MPAHELYVYYKVPPDQATSAGAQIHRLHQSLQAVIPGLHTSRLVRAEPSAQAQTWMEIYRHPEGLDSAALATIEAAGQAWPSARIGPRHTEVFDAEPMAD